MKKSTVFIALFFFYTHSIIGQWEFITTWNITSSNESITIPASLTNSCLFDVNWGDGYITTGQTAATTHTYSNPGYYQVSITGTYPDIVFGLTTPENRAKIVSVDQWGWQVWKELSWGFLECINLAGQASDAPDLSDITEIIGMFFNCTSFNQDIGSWDVSNVTIMSGMFTNCFSFNQDIGSWDVSNVTYIGSLFSNCTSFNQDIGSWDVSNVTNMDLMFLGATSFNQNIGEWDISNVTEMNNMFEDATSFNQDIGAWDVSNTTAMHSMFNDATSFNQDIGNWDVSSVVYMSEMFNDATSFNQDIGAWDVSNTIEMQTMFKNATSFNQNIGAWDVSNVTRMYNMFENAISFDQDIGNWDVSNVTNMTDMFKDATLSSDNYDALLMGWSNLNLQANIDFHGGNSMYCLGGAARDNIIFNHGWTITDGGLDPSCSPPSCTSLIYPYNGASDVFILTDLTWNAVTNATGYKLSIGTSSGGPVLYSYYEVGNITTFGPLGLDCASTVYVTITPFNDFGDAVGCPEEYFTTETIDADAGFDVAICMGNSVQLQAIGGTVFSWWPTDGLDDPNIPNPVASPDITTTYYVTVSTGNGCEDTDDVTVTVYPTPVPNATVNGETCFMCQDGTATANPFDGTPPYSYYWSNGETSQSIFNLAPDTYIVTVTDINGCENTEWVIVEEFICPDLTIESYKQDITCFSWCSGVLSVTGVVNGIMPYNYFWSDGQTTQSIIDLCPGDYMVTVIDAVNCEVVSDIFTITEPDELIANLTSTNESCFQCEDGTATALPFGGTLPYSFNWSNGETSQTIDNLAPGSYGVTVTDINGCESIEWSNIEEFICPTLTIESFQLDVECFGDCTGSIEIIDISNGINPFSYEWSDGQTTAEVVTLCAGYYSVTVTDAVNCQITEYFIISEPNELLVSATATDETCYQCVDGTASATASGGTPAYDYEWSNGETTQTIDNLPAGDYSVIVTDDNDCEVTETVTVNEFICPSLSIQIIQENVLCNGDCTGSIEITNVVNGVSPYIYDWSNGESGSTIDNLCAGTYGVTISDAFNCEITAEYEITEPNILLANATATDETTNGANDGTATANPSGGTSPYSYEWSTGATTQSIGNLNPNTYSVTVSDAIDCQSIETVPVNAFECPNLSINIDQIDVSCFEHCNGSLTITDIIGGIAPFTYSWSNGASIQGIDNLCSGQYSVTVTDAVNCTVEGTYFITEPAELLANASSTYETSNNANDGTATANPIGGTPSYEYSWSNGESTQTITGLSPAAYTVMVTDANGCESIETVSVAEFGCQGLNILSTVNYNLCFGDCIGSIEITGVYGGQAPFTYTWGDGSAESSLSDLCSGTYNVTIVDGNNCSVLGSYTIETPNELIVNINSTDESGYETNDGSATANPIGGTSPYTYLWSNGEATKNINGLSPDTYTVTVTDANGCMVIGSATIIEFVCPLLEIESTVINASCFGQCDGTITITNVVNAVSPLTYTWSNGASTANNSNLCIGDYSVTITDSKNCSIEQTYTITEPNEIVITVDEVVHVRVGQLGSINISTNGDYTYDWKGDNDYKSTEEDITDLEIGCYALVVTNPATGCSIDTTICVDDLTATNDWKELSVNVYPNPVDKILTIDFGETFDREINVSITDLSGSQVIVQRKKGTDKKLMVDTKTLDAGIYILKLQVEGKYLYKKIVVIH